MLCGYRRTSARVRTTAATAATTALPFFLLSNEIDNDPSNQRAYRAENYPINPIHILLLLAFIPRRHAHNGGKTLSKK